MQEQTETLAFSDTGTVEGYRLSPQQRRLWGALGGERAERESAQVALSVTGADSGRLRRALEEVCNRHEALRTGFGRLAGMRHPLQVISDECAVRWRDAGWVEDLRELLREERERASVGEGAGFGGCVAEVEGAGVVLALTAPALCCDLRSLVNVAGEVAAGLSGVGAGGDEDEAEVVQYVQFSEWQNELAEGEGGEAGRAFWREALDRFGAQGELRLGLEAAPGGEFVWGEVSTSLPAAEVTRGTGAGEEEVLLSCWVALLGRLGGRSSVPISVLLHGRSFEEMETAVGLYASSAPLNGDVQPDFTFTELLSQVGQTLLEAYEWQECYAAEEQAGSPDSETTSSNHRIGYEYVEWPNVEGPAGGPLCPLLLSPPAEPFKLCLRVLRTGASLRLTLYHDSSRVSTEWARLLLGQYETLLRSCLADPSAPLSRHDALSQAEREDALSQSAHNSRPYPRTPLLPELIALAAREEPEAEAVVDGARTVTRARMWRAAGRVAGMLRGAGVRRGDRVGLLAGRSAEAIAGLLGCWRLGAAYVPLDGSQPEARLESMLDDCGARAVLTAGDSTLPVGGRAVLDLSAGLFSNEDEGEEQFDGGVEGGDIAYLIYTSGTTGRPKGVAVTHSSLLNLLHALDESVYSSHPVRRVSVNAPLWFDASVKQLVQLGLGRALVVVPEGVRADAEALTEWVVTSGVEAFDCTPSHLRALLGAGLRRRCEESGAGLRHLLVGGEAVDPALWAELGGWRGVTSHNLYGPTECTVDVTHRAISHESAPTLGLPLGNVEAYVLDARGRLCPSGVAGELCAGGAGIAVGYWGDARRTAERFVPDAFSGRPGARLYRTGDVARRGAGGLISYEGRADGQVKVRGFRIELGEVEAGLRQVGWVSEAAAAVVGEGDSARLVGYVVAHLMCEGAECGHEAAAAREYVGAVLPEYMMPAQVVVLDSLPLTTNGKLDRRALPAPEAMRRRERTAPRTETESALHDIWCEVLGLDAVSVDESFFELGGHSLVATRVMSRVREGMGAEVPLRRLFEAVTIEKLALAVDEARAQGAEKQGPALTRIDRSRFRAAEVDTEHSAG